MQPILPTLPIEKIEPTDMNDPIDPIDMNEPALANEAALVRDSPLAAERTEPALPTERMLRFAAKEAMDLVLAREAMLPRLSGPWVTVGAG